MARGRKRGAEASPERATRARTQRPPETPTAATQQRRRSTRRAAKQASPPAAPTAQAAQAGIAPPGEASSIIRINRAPVLTLWAAAVAEAQGQPWESAVTFGQRIAAMFAQSKGRSLGIFEPPSQESAEVAARRARERAGTFPVAVFGTSVLARTDPSDRTGSGRALAAAGAGVARPASAAAYLRRAFGERLPAATAALRRLAAAVPAAELQRPGIAYRLYCRIRPEVPLGIAGWGARGAFDLAAVDALAGQLEDEEKGKGKGHRGRSA